MEELESRKQRRVPTVRSPLEDCQVECSRGKRELDDFETFYRMGQADARVHAMGSPFVETDCGGMSLHRESLPRRVAWRTHGLGPLEFAESCTGRDNFSVRDLFCEEDGMYAACQAGRSGRPQGPWSAIFSGLFSCVLPRAPRRDRRASEQRARELLELSRKQESALADKQDTIDILERKLQQLQLFGQENERWTNGGSKRLIRDPPEDVPEKARFDAAGYVTGVKLLDNDALAVLVLFDTAVVRARIAVRCFCRIFMKQMEHSGYAVWKALAELEPRALLARKEHGAFVLESHMNRVLFRSFESESFDDAGISKIMDPQQRCAIRLEEYETLNSVDAVDAVNRKHQLFDAEFLRFCDGKMREMWFSFPWNIIFHTPEQRAIFTGVFLDTAKNVWLLHRLAQALHPACSIVRVGKGSSIDSRYVEAVAIPPYEICRKCAKTKVEFMTMPGFRAHRRITKCQVYQHFKCR